MVGIKRLRASLPYTMYVECFEWVGAGGEGVYVAHRRHKGFEFINPDFVVSFNVERTHTKEPDQLRHESVIVGPLQKLVFRIFKCGPNVLGTTRTK